MPAAGSKVIYIGEEVQHLTSLDEITYISSRAEAESVKAGSIIRRWDYIMHISPTTYLRPSILAPLRFQSDILADNLVDALELKMGQDGLKVLQEIMLGKEGEGREEGEVDGRVGAFWRDIHREWYSEGDDLKPVEKAVIDDIRQEGRDVFWRYSTEIFGSLLHFSLAGGFSAPKLNAVMRETNYLTSASKNATYKRLLETTLFVIDAMNSMEVGTSRGWKSAVRVRILHAQVRKRIREGKGREGTYDQSEMGVPINQQDLGTVLGSFMIAPLWSLRRLGVKLSKREEESYQAAWTQVGFYLGMDPALLTQFYGQSFSLAEQNFACLAFDAFPDAIPANGYLTPTYQILSSVSNRPPRGTPVGYSLEYSRLLLGNGLSDQLKIPRGSRMEKFNVWRDTTASWSLIYFGRVWMRKGWEEDRVGLWKQVLELLVVWQLGERRSVFAWRDEKKREEKFDETEGEEPGIPMGRHIGLQVKRKWAWLVVEMVAVIGVVGIVSLGSLGLLVKGTLDFVSRFT